MANPSSCASYVEVPTFFNPTNTNSIEMVLVDCTCKKSTSKDTRVCIAIRV